jgi:hypothetical protein
MVKHFADNPVGPAYSQTVTVMVRTATMLALICALTSCTPSSTEGLAPSPPEDPMVGDDAGSGEWRDLYGTEVRAEPPQAPTFRLAREGAASTLNIANTGTLLCPFRVGPVEVSADRIDVQLTPGGPATGDMRRIGCGETGLALSLPDGTRPATIQSVRFVMNGITAVTTRTAPTKRQCRGPSGAC